MTHSLRSALVPVVALVALAGQPAHAQDAPKIEVGATYAVIPTLFAPACHGASGSVALNLNSWFGVVGDISGCTAEPSSGGLFSPRPGSRKWFTYLAGPRVSGRGRFTPHAHFLVGGAYFSLEDSFASESSNGFGMTIGLGLDLKITNRVGLRLIQPEYLRAKFDGVVSHHLRIQTGVVIALKK
jgi:opacity protein-like surface antigen